MFRTSSEQVSEKFGTDLTRVQGFVWTDLGHVQSFVWDRLWKAWTGTGQVWDRFRRRSWFCSGQVQDKFGVLEFFRIWSRSADY